MERGTRKFAGWVLAVHALIFLLLVTIVVLLARESYLSARAQALEQIRASTGTPDEQDQVVGKFLRKSIVGAVAIVLLMTAVLVFAATQAIRARLRVERIQHDVINKELAAAREIQLAWLPEHHDAKISVDI